MYVEGEGEMRDDWRSARPAARHRLASGHAKGLWMEVVSFSPMKSSIHSIV